MNEIHKIRVNETGMRSITDLTVMMESIGVDRDIYSMLITNRVKDFAYNLIISSGNHIQSIEFNDMVNNDGMVAVLKKYDLWDTYGRGESKQVFCNSYLWTVIAMESHPAVYAKILTSISYVGLSAITNDVIKFGFDNTLISKKDKPVHTYVMRDCANGYYKIGRSNNVDYRERTLQSEKPTIELIGRVIGDIESKMHEMFKHKRIRGEWFSLSNSDLKKLNKHIPLKF